MSDTVITLLVVLVVGPLLGAAACGMILFSVDRNVPAWIALPAVYLTVVGAAFGFGFLVT